MVAGIWRHRLVETIKFVGGLRKEVLTKLAEKIGKADTEL